MGREYDKASTRYVQAAHASTYLMWHSPVVNISKSFTTVLDLAKTPTPFSTHARSPIVPAVMSSQPTPQSRETVPSLDKQVKSFNNSHLLPTEVVAPYSSILPATRFSDTSPPPPKTGFSPDNENVPPTKPSATASAQAGLQNPQANIGLTLVQGVKRRLGMGRGGIGYANKKFKPPT